MRKTIQILFILLTGGVPPAVFSQDLHVYYDAQTEKIRYVSEGNEIYKPKIRKGNNIFLHVENYNNYLYDLEVKVDNEPVDIVNGNQNGTNFFASSPLSSFNGFFGLLNSGIGAGFENLSDLDFGGPGFGEKEEGRQQVDLAKQQFDKVAREMVQTETQLRTIQHGIQNYKDALEVKHLVLEEVQKLKYNPTLKPEQIKKMSLEYLEKGLEIKPEENINLVKLISQNNQRGHLIEKLDLLEKGHRNYKQQIKKMGSVSALLEGFGFADNDFLKFQKTVDEVLENAQAAEQNLPAQKKELKTLISEAQKGDLELLTAMRYEYESVSSNTFNHTYRAEATGDLAAFKLEFKLKDSLEYTRAKKQINVAPIKIPVFGNIKINTSIGVSFGQFFERPQSYFVRNAQIQADDLDSFLPMLTSFFHFYSQSPKSTSVGGTLGIGIPLSGPNGFQSATFFVGPSLILGKGQRVVFTTGIMGGRVERPAQGYSVGDTFSSEADAVPTHHPYEAGVFLGLSFNLSGG